MPARKWARCAFRRGTTRPLAAIVRRCDRAYNFVNAHRAMLVVRGDPTPTMAKACPTAILTHRLQIRCSAVRSIVRINDMSRSLDRKYSTKHRKQLSDRVMEKVLPHV